VVQISKFINRKITRDESRDTGMALVLLMLILFIALKQKAFLTGAIVLHVLNMTVPQLYRPAAVVWLGFSDLMGAVVSRVLMLVVFFVIVTPIGILRRLMGKDSLRLRAFKTGEDSVMLVRNYTFSARDLERPY
jgi:hypothetical protein